MKINPSDDFGFSFHSEDEVKGPVDRINELEKTIAGLRTELLQTKTCAMGMQDMINNLLDSFAAGDPKAEYIRWPNRVKKIAEFKNKIEKYRKNFFDKDTL